jgi:glycosyltransferase involved in cell wall biosynthesis
LKFATENLKLLVGMPEKTARGGINACEPPFLRELEKLGVVVSEEIYTFDNDERISIFWRIRQVWKTAFRFRQILREDDFNLLHLNTAFEPKAILRDAFSLFWLKNRGTKIFLKFHGSDINLLKMTNFAVSFLIKYLVKNADGIGLLSSEEKRAFVDCGFAEEKFFVVKNSLTDSPQKGSFPQVENFPSAEKSFRLLFVSRLIPTKGLLETVSAVAELRKKGFEVVLDVLGDGETRSVAEDLAKSLQGSEFINFHGHISEEEVQEFYRKSDLLVFPTFHNEGFPMVIFNALQFGLPIVTTKIRAAADYLKDGENCFFCEAKNPESVAEKIAKPLQNRDLRERMRENNRALANKFTAEKVAPEYLEIYKTILS